MIRRKVSEKITVDDIASVVRTTRRRLHLTQVEVSRAIGISQGALSKVEAAKAELSAIQWVSFCEYTGVSIRAFLNRASKKFKENGRESRR